MGSIISEKGSKLVIDYREKALIELLEKTNMKFESKNLDVADIEIWHNDQLLFLIERKTVDDYLNSISTQRLKNQLMRLQTASHTTGARVLILVEGSFLPQFGSKIIEVPSHLYNSLLNRMLIEELPVIRSETLNESVIWIQKILSKLEEFSQHQLKRQSGEVSALSATSYLETVKIKKGDNIGIDNCFILQLRQIPGVSLNMATAIKSQYNSFLKLIDAYRTLQTQKQKENMLAKINLGQRVLGPVVSKRIFQYLMSDEL